jgi:prophage antirepressor-like protein
MDNNLQIFSNEEFGQIEIVVINGEPFIELYSVGQALGYVKTDIKNGKEYKRIRIDRIDIVIENAEIKPFAHGGRKYLSEEMLYDFMLEAKTSKCRSFKRWITHDVLPSIRKHGAYMTEEVIEKTLSDPDFIIQLANQLKEERQKRLLIEQQIEEAQPKLDKYGIFLDAEGTYTFEQVSKMLSTRSKDEGSTIKVNKKTLPSILRECGVISRNKTNGRYRNLPNVGYENYFNICHENIDNRDDIDSEQTRVKTIGIDYIYDLLSERKEKGLAVFG